MRYGTIGEKPGGASGGSGGGARVSKIWTNPSPTSNFAAQTVPLNLSSYDAIICVFKLNTTATSVVSEMSVKGEIDTAAFHFGNYTTAAVPTITRRTFSCNSSGVVFGAGQTKSATSSASASTNNSYMIPTEIYGVVFG